MGMKKGWKLLRSTTGVDDPQLVAGTFDSKPTFAVEIHSQFDQGIHIIAAGGGAADQTFTVNLWGGRGGDGPALFLGTLVFTLGTAVFNFTPTPLRVADATVDLWADGVAVTNGYVRDIDPSADQDNNRVVSVHMDTLDLDWIAAEVSAKDTVDQFRLWFATVEE